MARSPLLSRADARMSFPWWNLRAASLLAGLALVTLVGLGIVYCPVPWSVAMVGIVIALAVLVTRSVGDTARIVLLNVGAVCLALAAFEAYLGVEQLRGDGTRVEGSIIQGFVHPDDVLGYAPNPNARVTARKYYGDLLLYDVAYSIGQDGLRKPPPVADGSLRGCIVFFGDSHTFGEGVEDDQTFPYQVGLKTGGQYAVYNFGFSGYGPHQMLASLQSGKPDQVLHCRPTQIVYTALLEHIARVAGLTTWDKHGPRFSLSAAGVLRRKGHFDDPPRWMGSVNIPAGIAAAVSRCYSCQRVFGRGRDPSSADLELFVAVLRESAKLARERYPGSAFHVLLYDGRNDQRLGMIEAKLTDDGVPVLKLTSAIPDFTSDWLRYVISPHDLHPNALQYRRLADYLVREVIDGGRN